MQLTMVSAVPFSSTGAFCATNVENKGESAITTIPQKRRKEINTIPDSRENISGEIRQHRHDKNSAIDAIRLVSNTCAKYPAITHAKPPIPIIRNDNRGMLYMASGYALS